MTSSAQRADRHPVMPRRSALLGRRPRGIGTGAGHDRKIRTTEQRFSLLIAVVVSLAAMTPAGADSGEEFYRSKTITMYVGTGVGAGAVSAYPTALAPLIKKYLPGHPDVIVSYMPGGGGIKAANYIYGIGPQDGTAWGFITRGFLLAPLLKIPQAQFDPNKINWIGSPTRTISMGMVWNTSTDVRTIQDAMREEVVVGATSIAQDTGIFPRALNSIAGTRFKIVPGYAGLAAVDLAIERGEVQGKVGSTWKSLNSGPTSAWVSDKKVTILVQLGVKKAPDIPENIPLGLDLAKSPEDRAVLEVLCAPSATGYPSFMGPGVPKDRVAAIRLAYQQSLEDPEFIAAIRKEGLDLDPISAEELAEVVRRIYALPEAAVDRARDLLPAL
jgi:tripartite-type tricarboxylate transporter receptor subunit TctC